jgi:undecaprenyl-diphosphatase
LIEISGLSYPSGHSLVSTATYLSIAFLFYRRIDSKFLKILTLGMAGLIIFFIGFSRIYLGVHYPSDVLSGILFGISLVLWLIALFKSFSIF